jgi:hypothetical protein
MRLLEIEDCITGEEELSVENEPMNERLHRLHYNRELALENLRDRTVARGRVEEDLELLARVMILVQYGDFPT